MHRRLLAAALVTAAPLALSPAASHEPAVTTAPASAAAASKPVPKEQLLVPPAGAKHYVVVSQAGKHGDQWVWTQPDGSVHRIALPAAAPTHSGGCLMKIDLDRTSAVGAT